MLDFFSPIKRTRPMSLLYKLTRANWTSGTPCYGPFEKNYYDEKYVLKWGPGVTHEIEKKEEEKKTSHFSSHNYFGLYKTLCTTDYLHAYETIELASLLKNSNVNKSFSVLWEAEGEIAKIEGGKVGTTKLTTVKLSEKPLLELSLDTKRSMIEDLRKRQKDDNNDVLYMWMSSHKVEDLEKLYKWSLENEPEICEWSTVEDYIINIRLSAILYGKSEDELKEYAAKLFAGQQQENTV